ncbi:MAG: hypothetical protein GY725_18090 [bacterium]|nr:hypothetical protein [bacterium]
MPKLPEVRIPATEQRLIEAKDIRSPFEISIALPAFYTRSEKHYPVIYTLDSNGMFGLVSDSVRLLRLGQEPRPARRTERNLGSL